MDKLKLIKLIVVVLTFLLVFGTLAALGTVYRKVSSSGNIAVFNLNLHQPDGSSIEDFKLQDQKLYLLIKYGGQPDRIIIIDSAEPTAKPAVIRIQ